MTNSNPILHQTSREPLYSLSRLEKACHRDPVFIRKMTGLFIRQLPKAVQDIRTSFEKKDYKTMKAVAHRIKPALDNMCVVSLQQVIRDIEYYADQPYPVEKLNEDIQLIENIMDKVITALKMEFKGISS